MDRSVSHEVHKVHDVFWFSRRSGGCEERDGEAGCWDLIWIGLSGSG